MVMDTLMPIFMRKMRRRLWTSELAPGNELLTTMLLPRLLRALFSSETTVVKVPEFGMGMPLS